MIIRTSAAVTALVLCLSAPSTGRTAGGQPAQVPAVPAESYFDWSSPQFTPDEYRARRTRLTAALAASGGGLFLTPSRSGRSDGGTFRQRDDFLYFTGLELPDSILAIDADTRQTMIFAPAQDARFANLTRLNDFPGRPLQVDSEIGRRTGLGNLQPIERFAGMLSGWARDGRLIRLNPGEPGVLRQRQLEPIQTWSPLEHFHAFLAHARPSPRLESAYAEVARLRMVKSAAEIAVIRRSTALAADGIRQTAPAIHDGVDERSLETEIESTWKRGGAQRVAFASIVKSGPNALWPWRILAAQSNRRNRAMKNGELVIFDVGCELDSYVSDVGRTFPVSGTFSPEQRRLLEMEVAVADALIAAIRPGVTLAQVQRAGAARIPADAQPYMQTGLYFGHHIGLSSGDPSLADAPLEPGMVVTVEPWYYNHDRGVSVFTEDDVLVTTDGHENLTRELPRTPDGLERLMRRGTAVPARVTRDGVLAFIPSLTDGTITVWDRLNNVQLAAPRVCPAPVSGALTPDEVSFVALCENTRELVVVNTASFAVVHRLPATPKVEVGADGLGRPVHAVVSGGTVSFSEPAPSLRQPGKKNEVIVLGTIHGEHLTSRRFGVDVLKNIVRAIAPAYVLTEISPNRLDQARREFAETGTIVEPRISRFPEYVNVLFPLTREMAFQIIPTAGWNSPMDRFRTATLKRIEQSPARAADWARYAADNGRSEAATRAGGAADDPRWVNSEAYDAAQRIGLRTYNELFDRELGTGGWDTINRAHFANIARALDAHAGEGVRILITYGAGHRSWFIPALEQRADIALVDPAPYFDKAGIPR